MISPSKRGVCVEYKAACLFIEAGFEVFLNASPDGPVDLVVWDGANTYLIDCKTLTKYLRKDGSVSYNAEKNKHPHVHYLGYHPDCWLWLSQNVPQPLKEVI